MGFRIGMDYNITILSTYGSISYILHHKLMPGQNRLHCLTGNSSGLTRQAWKLLLLVLHVAASIITMQSLSLTHAANNNLSGHCKRSAQL